MKLTSDESDGIKIGIFAFCVFVALIIATTLLWCEGLLGFWLARQTEKWLGL